ncbi:hypothetical protein JCM8547_005155 [Rhodosporidiobolus lusitaniae]
MLDRLPHDLVLLLCDLIVPPPTSANLEERCLACQRLSRIARNWTAAGQKKLVEQLQITAWPDERRRSRVEERMKWANQEGRAVRGLDVKAVGGQLGERATLLKAVERSESLRDLVLRNFEDFPLSWSACRDLRSLSFHSTTIGRSFSLSTFPPFTLTRLALYDLNLVHLPPLFPHISTLLLRGGSILKSPSTYPFLSSFPSLQILAWDEVAPTPSYAFFSHAPVTLKHLLLGIPTPVHYGTERSALVALEEKRDAGLRLESLTYRAREGPDETVASEVGVTEAWCGEAGTAFELVVRKKGEFDLEMWAVKR